MTVLGSSWGVLGTSWDPSGTQVDFLIDFAFVGDPLGKVLGELLDAKRFIMDAKVILGSVPGVFSAIHWKRRIVVGCHALDLDSKMNAKSIKHRFENEIEIRLCFPIYLS